jgi:dolichol kinase
MQARTVLRYVCYLFATLLVLCSLFCLLWVVSSSSMAFTDCAGSYELFAENQRCRQPSVAGLLALVSLVCAVAVGYFGRRFCR